MDEDVVLDMEQPDYILKILIIGNSGVGKSSLLVRFAEDTFSPSYISTIGVDFKMKTVEVDGKILKMQIWDTAGQERFKTITSSYYHGAHGIFIVYDVTDAASFEGVAHWIGEIAKYGSHNELGKMLIGNKIDKPGRQITAVRGKELADSLRMTFMETSAKDGLNVQDAFLLLAQRVKEKMVTNSLSYAPGGLILDPNAAQDKDQYCGYESFDCGW